MLSGNTGILVQAEAPAEMAKAIERICQLPSAEWQTMSEAAYAKVINYSWEDATDLFEAGLRAAVDKSQKRDIQIVSRSPYYVGPENKVSPLKV